MSLTPLEDVVADTVMANAGFRGNFPAARRAAADIVHAIRDNKEGSAEMLDLLGGSTLENLLPVRVRYNGATVGAFETFDAAARFVIQVMPSQYGETYTSTKITITQESEGN